MPASVIEVGIEQLQLSPARPKGYVPRPSATLKRRIAKHGVLDPLAVRPIGTKAFEILSRPTTWVAAGLAGIRTLPVTLHEELSDAEAAEIVADHYQVVVLNPMDEAQDYHDQLQALGGAGRRGAVTRLSRRLGVPRAQLAHSLRLLGLPRVIQKRVECGDLSAGHARPLISLADRGLQLRLAARIVAEQLSVRDTERLASSYRLGLQAIETTSDARQAPDANVLKLQRRISELAGCPFELRGNEAVFNFFGDYEVLDGLLKRIGYGED
mgnify:CR=1 FL=1